VGAKRDDGWIWAGSLDSGNTKRLLGAESGAFYAGPGYLLFLRGGAVLAQPILNWNARLIRN